MSKQEPKTFAEHDGSPFFIDDKFYTDYDDLLWEFENYKHFEDDWSIVAYESKKEKLFDLSAETIGDHVAESLLEERYSENNGDKEYEIIRKLIAENIDMDKIREGSPELWYATNETFRITKQDLASLDPHSDE